MSAHWHCLSPDCDESGELDEIRQNGGDDVKHMRATGHGVTAWVGERDE